MSHLTKFSSPAMQTMLAENSNGNGESCDQRQHDIHCPDMVIKGLNARRENCVERANSKDVPLACRKCDIAKKINPGIIPKYKSLSCACGKPREKKKKYCTACREDAARKYAARKREKESPVNRHCECGNPLAKQRSLCDPCRDEKKEERRVAFNLSMRWKRQQKKEKLKSELKEK